VWADLAGELRAASLAGLADTIPLNSCYVARCRALPLPSAILDDQELLTLSHAARTGHWLQSDLDDITARHLDLSDGHRATLLRSLGPHAQNRR
jgi:hypothetical protein